MNQSEIRELQLFATELRMDAVTAVYSGKSGHPGGSLSVMDTLAYLYKKVLRANPENPKDPNRDRFVLSKGHVTPAYYAVLSGMGFFPKEELLGFRQTGRLLQGHPDMKNIPGVDMSTGSLGQGISAAAGMAVAARVLNADYRVFAVLGDGELEEGQVWEASMFAAAKKLDNLIAVVDNNGLQIDGAIEKVNSPYPITDKFQAFGWNVVTADAHDFNSIEAAFGGALANIGKGKPTVIVQKSVKGKGVSYMENQASWHGNAPNEEQYRQAMEELGNLKKELEGGING